jgi:hypothetical protein
MGLVGSVGTFFFGMIGFYALAIAWNWRKENFWDRDPDALRPAEELAKLEGNKTE